MEIVLSDHQPLSVHSLIQYASHPFKIRIEPALLKKAEKSYDYLSQKIKVTNRPIYGVNTGFGSLCHVIIDAEQMAQLQENLIQSHACGTGKELPTHITKWIMLSKIQNLLLGHSAVHPRTIQRLVDMFNNDIYPVIYQQGSLGASGDLAPLAHLALPLIGKGEVYYHHQKINTSELFKILHWTKISLQPKEGLALLNGTQYMSGIGIYLLIHAIPLLTLSNIVAAVSLDAFNCKQEPFHNLIHQVRAHKGQYVVAQQINYILQDSSLFHHTENKAVQDPYSFRCIPQIHGASYDLIQFCLQVIDTEINSVTDNPLIFPDEDKILSGGNFHGQILSNALDMLALALNQLGSISERRTYQLISGSRNLPPFLIYNSGLHSGFMIPQYTAASIVNRNKILCTPASADNIISSNGQEDYVSMGANAANKCIEILDNVKNILAIEFFTAAQALEFRRPHTSSTFIENILQTYRKLVPFIQQDTEMHIHIHNTRQFLEENMHQWHLELYTH